MVNFVDITEDGARQIAAADLTNAFDSVRQVSDSALSAAANALSIAGTSGTAATAASALANTALTAANGAANAAAAAMTALAQISVNVRQHGATGNGTTDDTAAIQACIDSVSTAGGGRVFFPIGTYSHTGLILRHGVMLAGAATVGFSGLGPDLPTSKLVLRPNSNRSSIFVPLKQNPGSNYPANLYGTANIGIKHLWIAGAGLTQAATSHGIEFEASNYLINLTGATTSGSAVLSGLGSTAGIERGALVSGTGVPSGAYVASFTTDTITMSAPATATGSGVAIQVSNIAVDGHDSASCIDDVYVSDARDDGVVVNLGWRNVILDDVLCMSCGQNGFNIVSSDNRFNSCTALLNVGHGFRVGSVSNRLTSCESAANGGNGFRLVLVVSSTTGNTLVACTADTNAKEGIYVENGAFGTSIIGGLLSNNGTVTPNAYANLRDVNGGNGAVILGMTFGVAGGTQYSRYHVQSDGVVEVVGCTFVPGTVVTAVFSDTTRARFSAPGGLAHINAAGTVIFGGDTDFYRSAAGIVGTTGKLRAVAGLAVGNAVPATAPGSCVAKMQIFNAQGDSLGYVPIYSAIT